MNKIDLGSKLNLSDEVMRKIGYYAIDQIISRERNISERSIGKVSDSKSLLDKYDGMIPEKPRNPMVL